MKVDHQFIFSVNDNLKGPALKELRTDSEVLFVIVNFNGSSVLNCSKLLKAT